jgi:hypothetical protein
MRCAHRFGRGAITQCVRDALVGRDYCGQHAANPTGVPAYTMPPVRIAFEERARQLGFLTGRLAFHHEDIDCYANPDVQSAYVWFVDGWNMREARRG